MRNLDPNSARNLTLASRAVLIAAALDAVPGALDGVAYGDSIDLDGDGLTVHAGPPAPGVRLSDDDLMAAAMADALAPDVATDVGGVA